MRFTCDACVRKVCVCVLDVSSVYLKKMRAFVFVLFCIFISPINSQLLYDQVYFRAYLSLVILFFRGITLKPRLSIFLASQCSKVMKPLK